MVFKPPIYRATDVGRALPDIVHSETSSYGARQAPIVGRSPTYLELTTRF
ncbi:hypothetical protein SAMN05216315_10745 [Nitrosospira sp. Nsp18]|nr:hypothetical protein SAMN05216315_10745 [Nitrosospira sp. Nsp18]